MNMRKLNRLVAMALLGWTASAGAQTPANLQGPTPPQPVSSDADLVPRMPSHSVSPPAGEGTSIVLKAVRLSGNTLISSDALIRAMGPVQGRSFDMAGLLALAAKVAAVYRADGYPFTQAYLPEQDLKSGVLQITVLEGRYGVVRATGKGHLSASAQPFLDHGLHHGDPIQNDKLERALLILDDQPGIKIRPIIRPGASLGEADLAVNVERSSETSGEIGVDNTGARSTGLYRLHALLDINSPFRFGDKIELNSMVTDQHMWLGSVDYMTPLGFSGLRGQIGYAHTSYQLGAQFAALDAVGYAKSTTARLSYPLVRSQATNVEVSLGLQHKALQDDYRAAGVVRDKTSNGIPMMVKFDRRDAAFGGGITYGMFSVLSGKLSLDDASLLNDELTARSSGSYTKANLDIARIQSMAGNLSLYLRYSGQWASKNLDASEKFNVGGFYGVRAYPLGEASGDRGWLTQLELRYAIGKMTPFAFYDSGRSKANAQPWDANSNADRSISGGGLGLRAAYRGWSLESVLAWRTHGGAPISDTGNHTPRFLLMLGRRF